LKTVIEVSEMVSVEMSTPNAVMIP